MFDIIMLATINVVLLVLVIHLDARRDRWLTIARALAVELAYSEQRVRLLSTEPITTPDDALVNMKHCLTCDHLFHANHFVVNRTHIPLFSNV